MAIPTIAPYRLPRSAELTPNRVCWRPAPERSALLIHDLQRYFLRPYGAGASPLPEVLENIQRLRKHCRKLKIPVFYSAQRGGQVRSDRGLLWEFWGPGMRSDPGESGIVEGLEPAPDDIRLYKVKYSAFHATNLREALLERGRNQIIICGVYAHIGVLATAIDAFMLDIEAFVVSDAVADFSAADHKMAIDYAARHCAAVWSSEDVVSALSGRGETLAS